MRRALVAYGVALVVLIMLTREFEAAGWQDVGALEVTAALVDSLLVLAVAAGLLLAGRLGLERWARSMARWRRQRALAEHLDWADAEVVGVTSWRTVPPEPPAEIGPAPTAAQPAPAGFTYVGPSYGDDVRPTPPFPERPGRRI
ncbi:hypothetical protein [Blastococcus goldschmidtiae]|uniref:Uncharacterized protein n=1 Tax=Blastococcus goldschmidtiae TaxID=3075546 RepID=A0ABU2KCR8_9ACTN|nr:hypothetical protein [Blastococcus sp. DSM 46792]MDT0277991.1 hypothetical protein [Blastococcus sp. DSM 46792]